MLLRRKLGNIFLGFIIRRPLMALLINISKKGKKWWEDRLQWIKDSELACRVLWFWLVYCQEFSNVFVFIWAQILWTFFFSFYVIVANSNCCLCSAIILNIRLCFYTFMHIQSYMTTCSFLNYLLSSSLLSSSTYYHFTFNVNGIYLNLMY